MRPEVTEISTRHQVPYGKLLERSTSAMFSHTLGYQGLLNDFLGAGSCSLVAEDKGRIVGALPLSKTTAETGTVVNSLPFMGSCGGVLLDSRLEDDERREVAKHLFNGIEEHTSDTDVVTVITSQFDESNGDGGNTLYEDLLDYRFRRDRTAQVTEFDPEVCSRLPVESEPPEETPTSKNDAETLGEYLFTKFEKRTRRAVRRPYKEGLDVSFSREMEPLFTMHRAGMEAKGGKVKPLEFFELIEEHVPPWCYDVLYAEHEDELIAGLLVFYFDDVVEYYTPAYDYEHRELQATSLLIYEGMKRAASNGFRYWNFGGTRDSQESLYRFKRGWGAKDYPYHYYVVDTGGMDRLLGEDKDTLLQEFEWFYSVPFDELEQQD